LQGGEQCIAQKLDLVLLDAQLPNLNGTGVLRRFTTESNSTRGITAKQSVRTAENHRTNLLRKLDLYDLARLTHCTIKNGLVVVDNH
jgi:DNA-binding NarL/FixJ family response regulator